MVPIIQIVMVVPCQSEPSGPSREQFTKECNWIKLEEPRSRQHFILAGADNISFKPGADKASSRQSQ